MKALVQTVTSLAIFATVFCCGDFVTAQEVPTPTPEHEALKVDVGEWDVEIKAWQGPGDPVVSKGSETNKMLGGFWLVSDFKGKMFGFDFAGHGIYGYDPEKKKYVGTWVDSLGSPKMDMIGTYDKDKRQFRYEGMAMAPDGSQAKHILETTMTDDTHKVMTMHVEMGDQMMKIFEMSYTKK